MRKLNVAMAWIVLALGVIILIKTFASGPITGIPAGMVFGAALVIVGIARILMYRR